MLIFSSLKSRIHYFIETFSVHRISVKIDQFDLDKKENGILVFYRLGRKRLTQRSNISEFIVKYFDYLSGYDKQRISKFSTLQDLLINLFSTGSSEKNTLINYIKLAVKHDQLF